MFHDFLTAFKHSFTQSGVEHINSTHSLIHFRTVDKNIEFKTFQATWQLLPNIDFLYPWKDTEGIFSVFPLSIWMREYYWFPILTCIFYYFSVFGIQWAMKSREPFDLKIPLFLWNMSLSVFSTIGFIRTFPHLIMVIYNYSVYESMCMNVGNNFYSSEIGLWSVLFVLSKFPELIDTIFIVLRKKPLIFLHWYHHITVLLYCWQACATQSSVSLYFIAMNFFVHSIMYLYYAIQPFNYWPRWIPSWLITLLQTSQMVVGTSVCIISLLYKLIGRPCSFTNAAIYTGFAMYFSYFILFYQLLQKSLSKKRMKSE